MYQISFQHNQSKYFLKIGEKRYNQLVATNSTFITYTSNCITIDNQYFTQNTKVNDDIRFGINVNNKSVTKYFTISNENIILLLLESPHTSEYKIINNKLIPQKAANGIKLTEAGGAIDNYLCSVIKTINFNKARIISGNYRLCICNPIQYQTSLGSIIGGRLVKSIRDNIWKILWNDINVRNDFKKRISCYKPVYILNACTSSLKQEVTNELQLCGLLSQTIQLRHPAINWCRKKYF